MVKFKKGLLVITLVSLIMLSIRPFSILASTTGNQVSFTNNTSYSGSIKLYRVEIQPQTGYTGNTYTYGYYFQTDPGMYGLLSGNFDNNNNDVWSVAVQNGISEMFYSNKTSCYLKSATLIEYNQALPQEVIDYIAHIDENVEITADLIDQLVSYRQWNFPLESFTAIYPFMLKYTPQDLTTYNSYSFPLFDVKQGDIMFNGLYTSNTYYDTTLIFGINELLYDSNFNQVMTPTNPNYTRSVPETISRVLISSNPNVWYQIVRVDFHYSGTGTTAFGIQFNKDFRILPIYWNLKGNEYLSTDFALQFGLSNKLLNDLHIIAQGTTNSNNSASNLESSTSSFSSTASDVYNVEDQVSSGFSSSMQNIPSSFNFQNNFGSSFVVSASWVRDQFNNITANNPFGSLITFSLILGVALLIIGRLLS